MHTHTITDYRPDFPPAYLANGIVGLRIGKIPLLHASALLNGFYGLHEVEAVEAIAPAPYPVGADININGLWLSQRPDLVVFHRQSYDFTDGELATQFDFRVNSTTVRINMVTFCSRSMPTLVLQELRVEADRPCNLILRATVDPAGLPGRCLHRDTINVRWPVADGAMLWQSAGGIGLCGTAYSSDCIGMETPPPVVKDLWGHTSALRSEYSIPAQPGHSYALRQIGCLVPGLMHQEPHREAVRLVGLARHRGFEKLRLENRQAWAQIWKGRIRIVGASPHWQAITDASYFYLHSTAHASTPCSVPAWGLSRWQNYLGGVFWDCETFVFPPILLTAPAAARALLDYRIRLLPAARNNAALHGYPGLQFPWTSAVHGGEVMPAWAMAIFPEQHINMDVAFAFAQCAHAGNDEEFIRERAWPVLKGVAEWIVGRVIKTDRGYEIEHVTGIDEGVANVHNNAYTNAAAIVVLRQAIAIGKRLGRTVPQIWAEIADNMVLPLDAQTGVIANHDNYRCPKGPCNPEILAAFFPLTYRPEPRIEKATCQFYLDHAASFIGFPILPTLYGVYAARLGDRKRSLELFQAGFADYVVEPYHQCVEQFSHSKGDQAPPPTTYLANHGGFITALLYGLTGLQLGSGSPDTWCQTPICLPEGWEAIEVERIFVHGKPARLLARHGDPHAHITLHESTS